MIPEYELNLPPSNRGQLTTVEGLIRDVVADLSMDQPLRRIQTPEAYDKIDLLIVSLKKILGDDEEDEDDDGEGRHSVFFKASEKDLPMPAFTVKLDDPSGNSFIEFVGSMNDPKWSLRTYPRTFQQNVELGLVSADNAEAPADAQQLPKVTEESEDADIGGGDVGTNEEIFVFKGVCSSCGHPIDTLMKKVNIPYFKVNILLLSHLSSLMCMCRTSSSCLPTVTVADIGTMKSSLGARSLTRARRLLCGLKMPRTSAVIFLK